jgi:hypothetical protein
LFREDKVVFNFFYASREFATKAATWNNCLATVNFELMHELWVVKASS